MIDVYFIDVRAPEDVIESLAGLLTGIELERANRYRFADDRRRSIVARAAIRRLISRSLETDPRVIEIVEEEQGKPALPHRGIEFNASHSGDIVAIALTRETAVGIDVEQRRRMSDAHTLARRFFSADESAIVTAASDAEEAFLTIWTAKEAIVKATGRGIAESDLRGFTVPFDDPRMLPVVDGWSVATITPPLDHYYAAVAARGDDQSIISRTISPFSLI